jgi:hypothetical protein
MGMVVEVVTAVVVVDVVSLSTTNRAITATVPAATRAPRPIFRLRS